MQYRESCLGMVITNSSLLVHRRNKVTIPGANAIKKIYSKFRNSQFRSLDSKIGVWSKIREPLVTPNTGLLNF